MSQQPKKTFFGGLFDNIKEEFNKNKEMKDTIKKFREEAKKLEDSEALKDARKKYVSNRRLVCSHLQCIVLFCRN
jgi:mitochondrial import inner membrane translocase subunit TIM44